MYVGFQSNHQMKQIVKIMTLLVAITAMWISLLQTAMIPRSYTWLVSFFLLLKYFKAVFGTQKACVPNTT